MSDVESLPPNVQDRLARLQQLQGMLQSLVVQKQRVDIELNETDRALKTLENVSPDTKVYKSAGAILVAKPKDEIVKELDDRKELLEIRSKALEKQESKARERMTSLQQTLQRELNIKPSSITQE